MDFHINIIVYGTIFYCDDEATASRPGDNTKVLLYGCDFPAGFRRDRTLPTRCVFNAISVDT